MSWGEDEEEVWVDKGEDDDDDDGDADGDVIDDDMSPSLVDS